MHILCLVFYIFLFATNHMRVLQLSGLRINSLETLSRTRRKKFLSREERGPRDEWTTTKFQPTAKIWPC